MLYPIKFKTQFKDKIWGGNKIKTVLGKDFSPLPNCGETWEISGVKGNISEVEGGLLNKKNLVELIEKYKGELVGKKVYKQFGSDFPLLIKFLDANDDLSIQVHPNDELAKLKHNSFGKTEMWYIIGADEGAKLNTGFINTIDKSTFLAHSKVNTLNEILNFEDVKVGDVYFLPAGRVHYIGKGICLAEIQQTSDITYRIYDFDRKDDKGNLRDLHIEDALDAIDYNAYSNYKTKFEVIKNESSQLVDCQYFRTNLLDMNKVVIRDYSHIDSFVIYICVEGIVELLTESGRTLIKKGDCILLPSSFNIVELVPQFNAKVLEVWIP